MWRWAFVIACAIVSTGVRAVAQPEAMGPHAVASWDAGSIPAAGAAIRTVVYYPTDAPAPGPVVMVVHGNLRNGSYHRRTAEVFASRGLVAVVPDMPCGVGGCDHEANALQIRALSEWAVTQGSTPGSTLEGLVDGSRRALVGHSWGGLGTFLAASGSSLFDAWVGFDPEEDRGAALAAAPMVTIPSLHLMAEVDGACNGNWGADVYAATSMPHLRATVAGSGHCDPEEPTDSLCDFACAAGDRATTPIFRRYAVAFVTCALGMDPGMGEWVGGSSYLADVSAGTLIGVMEQGIGGVDCGASVVDPPDAGAVDAGADDGGAADAGAGEDAGASAMDASLDRDAAVPGADGAVVARDGAALDGGSAEEGSGAGGCGCRVARGDGSRAGLAIAALGIVIAVRRRRR